MDVIKLSIGKRKTSQAKTFKAINSHKQIDLIRLRSSLPTLG